MVAKTPPAPDAEWDIIIQPPQGFVPLDLRAVWTYRNLIWLFFKRDFVAFYKQTVLGPLWYLIQPTLTAFTFYIIFGRIANISTNGVPPFLFYMSGIVLWGYFANCLTNNSEIFSKNASLFGKVYFPRMVVPISVAMSGVVAFGIQFGLLLTVTLMFVLTNGSVSFPGPGIVLIPVLIFYVACLGVGVGLIVSAMTVRFRDLAFAAGFVTQLWMFATPVVYPYTQIPVQYQWFFFINPMSAPVETIRHLMFSTPAVPAGLWVGNTAITFVLLVTGVVLFTRSESVAMDTV